MIVSIFPILDKFIYISQYMNPAKNNDMKVIKLFEKYLLFLKNKGKEYLVFGIIKAINFIK
jgi:hypothetical protein